MSFTAFGPDLTRALEAARTAGRSWLLETEALAVAATLGLRVPAFLYVADAAAASRADLSRLPGDRVVVKVLSPEILHKSDVGGVAVVEKEPRVVAAAVAAMADRLAAFQVGGFGIFECIPHDAALGGELLLGIRWAEDFGPVVTFGAGGLDTEHLERNLRPGRGVAHLSPGLTPPGALRDILAGKALTDLLTGSSRGRRPRVATEALESLLADALSFAATALPGTVEELEINPLVPSEGGFAALDALVRLGPVAGAAAAVAPDPRWRAVRREKMRRLLAPRSLAVVGVSSQSLNPGRILLKNVLDAGFEPRRVFVVKPGVAEIEGCQAVADLASLPGPVDLLVLAVDAAQVPALVEEVVAEDRAQSLILIPGGLGETEGSGERVARLRSLLEEARRAAAGPVVVGGNCLGVRSVPGRYDTLFIPRRKLRFPNREPAPVAVLSQSGAFAVARSGKLPELNPRYVISYGNQLDLTVGDFLEHLEGDPAVEVFACYVEGFRPGDGRRFLEAARRLRDRGRTVILYRAGRTPDGAQATASHTATLAGDYAVTRELASAAGVVVAQSLADFEDLVRLFCALAAKRPDLAGEIGRGLGAVSNAGFECVAIADHLGPFALAPFEDGTRARLREILAAYRLEAVVGLKNPLDLTPIVGDEGFAEAARAILEDPGVDLGVVGCVPLTGALSTLAAGPDGSGEDVGRKGSVAQRLAALFHVTAKPWVAVVDGGPLYDPMARLLAEAGVPVFRSADRALRLLALWWRRWRGHG